MQNFLFPKCAREEESGDDDGDDKVTGLVEQFCYLGDELDCGESSACKSNSCMKKMARNSQFKGRVYETCEICSSVWS